MFEDKEIFMPQRKDRLTRPPEWRKHMRPFWKRKIAKAERRAAKEMIISELRLKDEEIENLGLSKTQADIDSLKYYYGKYIIPEGCYCYDQRGVCPYWDRASNKEHQNSGFCWFLMSGDWEEKHKVGELWDQLKNCGINDSGELYLDKEEEKETEKKEIKKCKPSIFRTLLTAAKKKISRFFC